MRWFAAILLLFFCGVASADDWDGGNRIKPGETRSYIVEGMGNSEILDARACATTIFNWEQDITGTQTTAEATLQSCAVVDPATVAECDAVTYLIDSEAGMAVSNKPGFFWMQVHIAPTGTAIGRMSAFCSDEFVAKPNFVSKIQLLDDANATAGTTIFPITLPSHYTRGYFVSESTVDSGTPAHIVSVQNSLTTNSWLICTGAIGFLGVDAVMLVGGEGFERTPGTAPQAALGVDIACNRALTKDMDISIFVNAGAMDFDVWFYGIPN